jgi:Fe-S cluster assembly protein SufB
MKKQITLSVRGDLDEKFLVEAAGNDNLKVKFVVNHDRPNTSSRIGIGILAKDHAKVAVDATTIIKPTASDTKAWLEIRVVTLDQANVVASPNLEIHNNAVKAGHALSTKHITDDELFYLTSRGLTQPAAKRLIIESALAPFRKGKVIS